jgi:hypothetical protein
VEKGSTENYLYGDLWAHLSLLQPRIGPGLPPRRRQPHPEQPLQRFPRPNLKKTAEAVLEVMAAARANKAGSYRQKWQGAKN